jgi:hypothetical protein
MSNLQLFFIAEMNLNVFVEKTEEAADLLGSASGAACLQQMIESPE